MGPVHPPRANLPYSDVGCWRDAHRRYNASWPACPWLGTIAGATSLPFPPLWIPAFAGKTSLGVGATSR